MIKIGTIINFVDEDIDRYIKLFKLTTDDKSQENIKEQIDNIKKHKSIVIFAEDNDIMIGEITARYIDFKTNDFIDDNEIYIDSFAVAKEYRNMGIGKRLLEECIKYALSFDDVKKIKILTRINSTGKKLCEKSGFIVQKRISHRFYEMVKKIR